MCCCSCHSLYLTISCPVTNLRFSSCISFFIFSFSLNLFSPSLLILFRSSKVLDISLANSMLTAKGVPYFKIIALRTFIVCETDLLTIGFVISFRKLVISGPFNICSLLTSSRPLKSYPALTQALSYESPSNR